MRIPCPFCGPRDAREFVYRGAALDRSEGGDWDARWHDYVHLRDNPAGPLVEHWYHTPCGTWTEVVRDTRSHALVKGE